MVAEDRTDQWQIRALAPDPLAPLFYLWIHKSQATDTRARLNKPVGQAELQTLQLFVQWDANAISQSATTEAWPHDINY